LDQQFKDFLNKCLIVESTDRPSVDILLSHPFMQKQCPCMEIYEKSVEAKQLKKSNSLLDGDEEPSNENNDEYNY